MNNKIFEKINNLDNIIRLDVGCGDHKISSDHIGIDVIDYKDVDIIGNYKEVFSKIEGQRVDEIYSSHFLEHIDDLKYFIEDSSRILKKGGKAIFKVPHFSNPYYYSDPTHVKFFGLYTFCYFAKCNFLKRKIPQYGHSINFIIDDIKINFKSTPPFYLRHGFKKILGIVINSSNYTKEFWEENLCYIFPAYELVFKLKKI